MKKLVSLLLCLTLMLSLSAGFTAFAEETEPAFDANLVGQWNLDHVEDNDAAYSPLLENMFKDLVFLHDGSFSCAALPYGYAKANNITAPKATTADGTIDLFAPLGEALSSAVNSLFVSWDDYEEVKQQVSAISSMVISYEFFDIPEEGYADYAPRSEAEKAFFKDNDKDGLKLHITAIVSENGLSRKSVEGSCTLHKAFREEFMAAYLTGTWSDTSGNTWRFGYVEKDGAIRYQYSVLLASGEFHETEPGYAIPWSHSVDDGVYGSFEPEFEDMSASYKITNIAADTMTIRDDVGEITMTREWTLF